MSRGHLERIPRGCGVLNFSSYGLGYQTVSDHLSLPSAGWVFMAFIDTSICQRVYLKTTRTYKLVYQSPVRVNKNTNHQFFFCIFDLRSKP